MEVKRQIQLAKKRNGPIIFLEYIDCGNTRTELLALVKNYKYKAIKIKKRNSGAKEIIDVIEKNKFGKRKIKICGVNSDCCVLNTTTDLVERLPESKIHVIKKACNTTSSNKGWNHYPTKTKNLKLVG